MSVVDRWWKDIIVNTHFAKNLVLNNNKSKKWENFIWKGKVKIKTFNRAMKTLERMKTITFSKNNQAKKLMIINIYEII